ncbi:MAG TPA: ECF-type sigma factor [Tepidisphaeraceae bacterium]|jgi:RNA polymerase sigma-70 factor (ECF subfamily)|nr:ECF-type sigma factor [Tepidisphaeraceae bacterium]
MSDDSQVLRVLERINGGDREAVADLFPLVYDELRQRARFLMAGERTDHTLQPTALVHEAFVKLLAGQGGSWEGRRHFYNAVTDAMRKILVDHARQKKAQKRGGGFARLDLDHVDPAGKEQEVDYEALDSALGRLQKLDERRYRVVMYRYFSGLREQEIADLLQLTVKTVQRDWKIARHFLAAEMTDRSEASGGGA